MIIDQYNAPDNVGSPEIRPLGPCGQAKADAGFSDLAQPRAAMAAPQPLYTQGRGMSMLGEQYSGSYLNQGWDIYWSFSPNVDHIPYPYFLVESGENMIYSKYIFRHPFQWKNIYIYIL